MYFINKGEDEEKFSYLSSFRIVVDVHRFIINHFKADLF